MFFRKFLFFILLNVTFLEASSLQLSKEEKKFLKEHKTITLGIDKSLKPFVVEKEKVVDGFEVELLERIRDVTGADFVLKSGDISKLRKEAIEGHIHGLTNQTSTKENKKYFDFTQSYLQMQKLLLTAADKKSEITNISQLKGKTVSLYKYNFLDKQIVSKLDGIKQKEFKTLEDTITSVVTHKADFMLSNGSIFYIINELGLPNVKPVYRLDMLANHHYAINKNYPELVSILNKALDAIGKDEILALKNKWFSKNLSATPTKEHKRLVLNFKEKEHLISLSDIRICKENIKNPAYKKYINVNNELIYEIEKLLLKKFETVGTNSIEESFDYLDSKKCDIISAAIKTEKHNQKAIFSKPYLEIPIVLATQEKSSTIIDVKYLQNFEVAVVQNRGIVSNVLSKYKNLTIKKVKNLKEAFTMLRSSKVDAVAGALGVLSEQIKMGSENFKINGTFNEKLYLTFALNKENRVLKQILNKAIEQIPKSKKDTIMNNYFGVKYEKGIDYTLIWMISTPLIIALFFYFLRVYDLKIMNKKLQILVDEEIEKSRKKDNLIFEQNKLVATGELVATITHQWKQPLSELGMSQNLLMTQIENGSIQQEKLLQEIQEQQKIVSFMSKTINTFKEFFQDESTNRKDLTFKVEDAYKDIEFLIAESLELNSIKVLKNIDSTAQLQGDKNALSHLFLAVVQNSIFFLKARDINTAFISIAIRQDSKNIYIDIKDNAKGVIPSKLPFIFDFNYSFRDKKQKSTGLGLHICDMIVSEKFKGSIQAKNEKDGLLLSITLPK